MQNIEMNEYKKISQYIPLDKSWMIRLGVLDMVNGYDDIIKFLSKQEVLSEDLQALYRTARDYKNDKPLDIGESGTLYRFLRFASWKLKKEKKFILRGSLKNRKICNNPAIIKWPLEKLLTLDNGTSQWASASVLMGNTETVQNPPYKLRLTYETVSHWNSRRNSSLCWLQRKDETIAKQADAYIELLKNRKTSFKTRHSEDYCFARAFNLVTPEEAKQKWPSLKGHESNRIEHMEEVIARADNQEIIESKDHRVVQAIVMRQKLRKEPIYIIDKIVVNKSWPQFWDFLEYCEKMLKKTRKKNK